MKKVPQFLIKYANYKLDTAFKKNDIATQKAIYKAIHQFEIGLLTIDDCIELILKSDTIGDY